MMDPFTCTTTYCPQLLKKSCRSLTHLTSPRSYRSGTARRAREKPGETGSRDSSSRSARVSWNRRWGERAKGGEGGKVEPDLKKEKSSTVVA